MIRVVESNNNSKKKIKEKIKYERVARSNSRVMLFVYSLLIILM